MQSDTTISKHVRNLSARESVNYICCCHILLIAYHGKTLEGIGVDVYSPLDNYTCLPIHLHMFIYDVIGPLCPIGPIFLIYLYCIYCPTIYLYCLVDVIRFTLEVNEEIT